MSSIEELKARAKEAGINYKMLVQENKVKTEVLAIEMGPHLPAIEMKTHLPATEMETHLPAIEMETHLPAIEMETHLPAIEMETHLPAIEMETHLPAIEMRPRLPAIEMETYLPSTEMETYLPPTAIRSSIRTKASPLKIKLPPIRSARTSSPINMGRILSQKASYNLRSRNSNEGLRYHNRSKKYKLKRKFSTPVWIPKESKFCFRDQLLTHVDLKTYHQAQEEIARKIIDSTFTIEKSQIDRFIYQSKKFIAMSWLTTLRIFEYQPTRGDYLEVKRMPNRYIKLSPHLLTSIHYCDSNFYLAYIWGSSEDGEGGTSPFIEARDLHGTLVGIPRYYEHIITSIYSDQNFIYVMTVTNTIYVHQRKFFEHICYQVNFDDFTEHKLLKAFINSPTYESFSKFPFIAATRYSLLFSRFNVLNHKLIHKHGYDDGFKIISIDQYKKSKKNPLYLIHRNSSKINFFKLDETLTKIEFGQYIRNSESMPLKLLRSLEFTYCILQVQIHEDKIYLFGYTETIAGNYHFEIGCISASDLMPQRTIVIPDGVGIDSKILVHDDNIVVVKNSQDFITIENYQTFTQRLHECIKCRLKIPEIDIQKHEQLGHQTIFSNYKSRILN